MTSELYTEDFAKLQLEIIIWKIFINFTAEQTAIPKNHSCLVSTKLSNYNLACIIIMEFFVVVVVIFNVHGSRLFWLGTKFPSSKYKSI